MTREEANKEIQALVARAYAAIRHAEEIADEHKLSFSFSPAYGMGGRYNGDPDDWGYDQEDGWRASSHSC